MLRDPFVVASRMVGHPVEDHLHALGVRIPDHLPELVDGAELRIQSLIVGYGIVAAEDSLASLLADGVHRHHPEDVHAEFLEPGKVLHESVDRAGIGVLAEIHLINNCVAAPFRVFDGSEGGVAFHRRLPVDVPFSTACGDQKCPR